MDEGTWARLVARVARGECTPFLGAGAAAATLPVGSAFAGELAAKYSIPATGPLDLALVTQYASVGVDDPMAAKDDVVARIEGAELPDFADPAEPHSVLASLPLPVYLTTNYDHFLEAALQHHGKSAASEICRWNRLLQEDDLLGSRFDDDGYRPTVAEPVVYHLHGDVSYRQSMVLTEDDYLAFLVNLQRNRDLLPPVIRRALTASALLFVGYSLRDWTFRVIFHGMVLGVEETVQTPGVAVQLPPDDWELSFQTELLRRRNIRAYWGTAAEFMAELGDRYRSHAGAPPRTP